MIKKTGLLFGGLSVFLGSILLVSWLATHVERVRQTVHHHANIAIYIGGERKDLSGDKYMEDIGACTTGREKTPRERVHFHENDMDTVHVHDDGVTWGHLFSNLGFDFTSQLIVFDGGEAVAVDGDKKWTFILNGREVIDPFNAQIISTDRLLMSYGTQEEDAIMKLFENMSANAHEHNEKNDPGTCSANEQQNILVKSLVEMIEPAKHSDHE